MAAGRLYCIALSSLHELDISDVRKFVLDGRLHAHADGRWSPKSDFAHSLLHLKHLLTSHALNTAQRNIKCGQLMDQTILIIWQRQSDLLCPCA